MDKFISNSLQGKKALVVGGSRGIGRAISIRLAGEGAAVAISYVKSKKETQGLVDDIIKKEGKAVGIQANLAKLGDIKRLFDEAEQALGQLDIVFINGADYLPSLIAETTEEEYDRIFNSNAKGVFFVMQQAAKRIKDRGSIIVTSSGGTKMFFTMNGLYLGCKGAIEQFVRVLSRELGKRNITVNAISPGFTNTDLLPERDRVIAADMSPFGRIGEPEDVADVAVFLSSDAARWVTGQNIAAGGGVF